MTDESLGKAQLTLRKNDPTTLSLRTGFGADLRATGSFAAARELDTESRILLEGNYKPKDPRTLRLLSSLATNHVLMSEYSTAQELFELAFADMNPANSGATPLDVISAWVGISWSLRLQGKLDDALAVAEDARDYGQNSSGLGPEHLSTLRAVNAYLITCRRLPDRRPEALEESAEVYELATRRHGESNPETLAIAVGRSNLMRSTNNSFHQRALELAEVTAERISAVYGARHPYYYGCMTNVALLKRATKDPAGARQLDQQALDGLTAGLGNNHHYTLTAAMNLASDLAALGQLTEAVSLGEDTLQRLTTLLGRTHSHTLGCAENLALDLIAAGKRNVGKSSRVRRCVCWRKRIGRTHLTTRRPQTVTGSTRTSIRPRSDYTRRLT